MSKIGKQIINIPTGTLVSSQDGLITVKGPKGVLTRNFRDEIKVQIEGNQIKLTPIKIDRFSQSLWGTYASHLKNMILGVNQPFEKKLFIEGVGYKVALVGKNLELALGFSHPVKVAIPDNLNVTVEKTNIAISGINKELVGEFAAYVRSLKKPEPYKGKGIAYQGEVIRRKQGKKTA